MSDTPRTDLAQHNMGSVLEPHYVVDVDCSRHLERELVAARAEVVRLKGEAQYGATFVQRAIDAERELAEAKAKERERCAKVCDEISNSMWLNDRKEIAEDCAAAIRKGE